MSEQPVQGEPNRGQRKPLDKWRLPLVSGKVSAFILAICFAGAAWLVLLIGARLQLPIWIRSETVIALWWIVWVIALTWFLYTGKRVTHDHSLSASRNWFAGFKTTQKTGGGGQSSSWGSINLGADGGEGCLALLAALVAMVIAIVALWFLIEVAIPLLAFFVYLLIRGMLARVANDFHGCRGNLFRAVFWSAAWATLYTAPLAFIIWIIHLGLRQA